MYRVSIAFFQRIISQIITNGSFNHFNRSQLGCLFEILLKFSIGSFVFRGYSFLKELSYQVTEVLCCD